MVEKRRSGFPFASRLWFRFGPREQRNAQGIFAHPVLKDPRGRVHPFLGGVVLLGLISMRKDEGVYQFQESERRAQMAVTRKLRPFVAPRCMNPKYPK